MKRIITHFLAAVLLLTVMGTGKALAQFSNGKVYRIVCSGTNSVSLGASALTDVAAVATSETDRSQQWYVKKNGDNYTFRNLANGRYLQGNNSMSSDWRLTETSNDFTVTTVSNNYCIRQVGHTNGYAYMHKDAGNNIVSWESSAVNSQWTPVEVAYSAEELQAVWDEVDALVVPDDIVERYQAVLDAVFTDKACTKLNSTYDSMSVDQIKADANYQALPATLQAMVLKVRGGDWSEANAINGKEGWSHDYAKRFRVQMYEPYSVEGEITSYLCINAHSNMDNPTGIYANAGEAIYIMVDGDIADGAELWVAHQAGLGATQKYNNVAHTQLHKGLNVVPYFSDASTLWIDYVVHTYDADGATLAEKFPHKISDYSPLKIHIEGGHINGFFNAIGDFRATTDAEDLWGAVDNDEDWNYYKERAPLNGTDAPNRDFPLLGSRQTLLFPLGKQANEGGALEEGLLYHLDNITVPSVPNCYGGNGNSYGNYSDAYYPGMGLDATNGKINIMLEAWDRITYSELASMGLVSKSTMDKMNSLYPRWTSEGTPAEIYDYKNAGSLDGKTYLEFCQGIDYSEYFNHHGAAVGAPSGYMSGGWRVCNYNYNTMDGVIGKIAAEAGPTWGPAHEIGHQHQSVFNLNGQKEVTNNFFSNVAVWYMGMGTSRVNGNCGSLESLLRLFNDKENCLYERLTDGDNIWAFAQMYHKLWLYYHLAGNNTQFWPRLFELCRQEPLVDGKEIDGETSLLRFYKHACNAAGEDLTEFFRAHGYLNVMDNVFVEDYTSAIYNMTQAQIDAAINEVKAKKYPVNYAVLFINDATGDTTPKHDGKTKRALWDGSATAELGCVNDFINELALISEYEATVTADGNVVITGGEGAVGFMLLDNGGRLLSFGNKSSFALSNEAKTQLDEGKATLFAVDAQSNAVKVKMSKLPAEGAFFRLKNTTSQLYMTVNSYNSGNQNDGGIVISAKNTEDLSKQVFRLVKHEDAYHLLTFNNNVVSTFASWGFRAEPGYSNAALVIEESTEDDIWTLQGTKGYIGTNNGATGDGSVLYSNHDGGKQNIYWAFEAVTDEEATAAAAAVVPTSISTLINDSSCYTITAYETNRGSWYSGDDALTSTVKKEVDRNAGDVNQQFAFIQYDGKYYLYSVAKKMFVAKGGDYTKYTKTVEDYVTFEKAAVASYAAPYVVALNGKNHMGISNGYTPAVITSYNSTSDGGNAVSIVRVGDFNPKEALETFNTVATVVYEYQYNGKTLATQKAAAVKGEAYPDLVTPELPLGYVVTGSKPAGTVEGDATVQITLGVDDSKVPFAFVAEGTPTTWYYAQMHAYPGYHWYVAPAADGTSVKTLDYKFTADEVDAHLWGFVGTVEGGFKMVNKASEKAIKSNNSGVAAMASVADATAFIAMPSQNKDWFCLRYPEGNYLNSQSNVINHWGDNDNGSSFFLTEYVDEDVTVEISKAGWATKYFGESVHVPAGVNAYIITGVENGWITKSQIAEGEVIPANTGVLLEGVEGKCAFRKTVSYSYTLAGNLLNGSVGDTYVEGEAYVLSNGVSGIGFYKAKLNKDAEGNEGTTHFKNNAGKAYLVLPAAGNSAAYYGFDWAGTTEISEVKGENVEVETIYDLTGRKLKGENGNLKGVYIINGKKVLVK